MSFTETTAEFALRRRCAAASASVVAATADFVLMASGSCYLNSVVPTHIMPEGFSPQHFQKKDGRVLHFSSKLAVRVRDACVCNMMYVSGTN